MLYAVRCVLHAARCRPSFLAAAVAWCVSYRLRCSGHVACCGLHRVERMQRVAVVLRAALGWCLLASWGVPCVVQHAACVPLQVASVASTGGVLRMLNGSATFESVAISDIAARVREEGEADRAGGGLGWRFAGWWRGEHI
jgi:hypothetical protein